MTLQRFLQRVNVVGNIIGRELHFLAAFAFLFSLLYYVVLMFSLIVRFQNLPNFIRFYNWPYNVKRIFVSTPSLNDSVLIAKDEWLLEIGYMNYQFGHGISEWSLFLLPVKMLGIFGLGTIIATNYLIIKERTNTCSSWIRHSSQATLGFGGLCVGFASITFSWVVCCSTPTWVVGLAMMGLGVSTSLWLEPLGFAVSLSGFIALIVGTYLATESHHSIKQSSKKNIARISDGNA